MNIGYIQFRHKGPASLAPEKDRPMGAVYVRVRLVNVYDEISAAEGRIKPEEIRSCEVDAFVDTGAARSVIPKAIYDRLGLLKFDVIEAEYADGRVEDVILCTPVRFHLMDRNTAEEAAVLGDEVLIGQTVLEKMDLLVDCNGQRLIPNPKHPNGPAFRV